MKILNSFSSIFCFITFVVRAVFMLTIYSIEAMGKVKEPRNNVHFYVARDMDRELWLYMGKPVRGDAEFYSDEPYNYVEFSGSIELFGLNENDYANLKWEDEPVEVFLNMED